MSIPVLCTSQTRQSTCNIRHAIGLERAWVEGIPLMNCSLSLMCKCGGHLGRITGSNADVADGGIRKVRARTRFAQQSIPGHSPPLRPKRAASGVAGLRYGSGQLKTNHALMSETSAGKPQPEAIPLNIYKHRISPFDALSLSRHTTRRARA